MMQQTIMADLDDLVLTVRDRNTRAYVAEAISAYRAQAFRAAILSTWIAVAYDIISKCRELDGQGDQEAKALIKEFDAAVGRWSSGDAGAVAVLQRLENSLLDKAREPFEFLSHQEHADLERLKQDRNLCAHPAFVGQDVLFQPTPELVRAHLVHAVLHLLQHPPVQGKSALERLKQDLSQPSFPSDSAAVYTFLEGKYLKHIKPALLKNVVAVLLKAVIKEADLDLRGREAQVCSSLTAIRQHSPEVYEATMAEQLPRLAEDLTDTDLGRVVRLFPSEPRAWGWLTPGVRIRLQTLAEAYTFYNAGEEDYLFDGLGIPELRSRLFAAVGRHDSTERETIILFNPRAEFKDMAIDLYAESGSFDSAERRIDNLILPLSDYFDAVDITRITEAIGSNGQIYGAWGSPPKVLDLFKRTARLHAETRTSWEQLVLRLREHGATFTELEKAMTAAGMRMPNSFGPYGVPNRDEPARTDKPDATPPER